MSRSDLLKYLQASGFLLALMTGYERITLSLLFFFLLSLPLKAQAGFEELGMLALQASFYFVGGCYLLCLYSSKERRRSKDGKLHICRAWAPFFFLLQFFSVSAHPSFPFLGFISF